MKKYLYNYIENIDSKIKENNISEKIKKEHLVKINFFQHERLIHLIVTISFAILTLISVIISKYYCSFIFITIILLICLVITVLSLSNNLLICSCVNHTVSSFIFTSNFTF